MVEGWFTTSQKFGHKHSLFPALSIVCDKQISNAQVHIVYV